MMQTDVPAVTAAAKNKKERGGIMSTKKERGFHELYDDDPERADAEIFGRRTGPSRRGFLGGAGLAAMTAAVGGSIAFADRMPFGLVPAALAQAAGSGPQPFSFEGKSKDLIVLQDRPLNVETPIHLLDPEITPAENMFIRNNGQIPDQAPDPKAWKVTIDGEVNTPLTLTVGELEQRFQPVTYRLQMECGGNGRSFFSPETRGNQWGHGAVQQGEWTGVRLGDVLKAAGAKPGAVYTGHYGADPHLSGDPASSRSPAGFPSPRPWTSIRSSPCASMASRYPIFTARPRGLSRRDGRARPHRSG
jgi:sulfite oxidase